MTGTPDIGAFEFGGPDIGAFETLSNQNYQDSFSLACTVAAAHNGSHGRIEGIAFDVDLTADISLDGVNSLVSMTIAASVVLAFGTQHAGNAAFTLAAELDALTNGSAGYPDAFSVGITADLALEFIRGSLNDLSFALVMGAANQGNSSFFPTLTMGVIVAAPHVGSAGYFDAFSMGTELDALAAFGWAAEFTFGTVHDVDPIGTQLAAAGLVALDIALDAPPSAMVSAVNSLTFPLVLTNPITSNIAAQSDVSLAIEAGYSNMVASLYSAAFSVGVEADLTAAASLSARNSLTLGISGALTASLLLNLNEDLSMGAILGAANTASLQANPGLTIAATIAADFIGGRRYNEVMGISADFDLLPSMTRGDSGPGIFGSGGAGTPGVFKPVVGSSVPGIFADTGDDSNPGIFKP